MLLLTLWIKLNCFKLYCTSIGQSLPYHKRWHSYGMNCKWSSGNYLFFFLAKKTRQFLFPTVPRDKKNLITDHVTPKHILVNHLASAKNVEDFLNLTLWKTAHHFPAIKCLPPSQDTIQISKILLRMNRTPRKILRDNLSTI